MMLLACLILIFLLCKSESLFWNIFLGKKNKQQKIFISCLGWKDRLDPHQPYMFCLFSPQKTDKRCAGKMKAQQYSVPKPSSCALGEGCISAALQCAPSALQVPTPPCWAAAPRCSRTDLWGLLIPCPTQGENPVCCWSQDQSARAPLSL